MISDGKWVSHKTPEITLAFPIKNMTKQTENLMILETPTLGTPPYNVYIYIMTYKKGSLSTMTWGFNTGYVLYIMFAWAIELGDNPKSQVKLPEVGSLPPFMGSQNWALEQDFPIGWKIPALNGGLVRWEHHRTKWEKEPERHAWWPEGTS